MEDTEEWQGPKEEGEDEEDGEMDESASFLLCYGWMSSNLIPTLGIQDSQRCHSFCD